MSIPVAHHDQVSGGRTRSVLAPARIVAAVKFLHGVLVEAWAMACAARRRYPHFE